MYEVYLLWTGSPSFRRLRGVFSDRVKAEEARAALSPDWPGGHVEEWTVDAEHGKVARTMWTVEGNLDEETRFEAFCEEEMIFPDEPCRVRRGEGHAGKPWVRVVSPVSAEHAIRVADEERRDWLHKQGRAVPA